MPFTYDEMKRAMAMKAAIEADPTAEQMLYVPARANPFENVVFIKNALASGSIMPPRDGVDPPRWIAFAPLAFMAVIGGVAALLHFCR